MRSVTKNYYFIRYLVLVFLVWGWQAGRAQNHTLTIQVADSAQIPVGNATIKINKQEKVVDSSGNIALHLASGLHRIMITAVGHYSASLVIPLYSDTSVKILLRSRESLLRNVVVTASRNLHRNQMSTQSLNIEQIKKLPVILGEVDPLKTITLLPGIKNGGEASAGIYVRGGGPDQNLVMLDGIPVYNPNHLLGFFSIFNGDAVKNMEVIKGGIPAEYGGRLSSVIAVETRSGSRDSLKGSGGIGLISSRVSLEGPLVKGKSSFILSGRRTYIDQVAKLVARDSIGNNGYFFYDVNFKADYLINKNNALYLTFYLGKDDFTFMDNDDDGPEREFNAIWGNTILGLTWKQQLNKKLKQELSAVRNDFNLDSRVAFGTSGFLFASGLTDYQLKNDWTYSPQNWIKWKWGWQYTWHAFRPGAGSSSAGVQEFKSTIHDQYAREAAAYLSTDLNITPRLNVIAGLRYSYFNQIGPTERILYDPEGVPTGETERYAKGQSIARYHYPEPRFSVLYRLPEKASLKLSYTRTIQYLHLATTSAATFPSDLWVPSGKLIHPAKAEQVAAGYFKDFGNGAYEMSVEAYYKTMSNQLEFRPGAQLLLNQNMEGEMIFGTGKAYGLELFLQKKTGRLTGWIGYTLSRTERTFPDMNNGKAFPYRYDRTHDVSIVANYTLSKKWEAAAVFVYGTGNALTMPTGRFAYSLGIDGEEREPIFTSINQYDKVNDYRMPAYHRMDIAFTYTPKPNSTKRFRSSWNFSLYNIYNRYNPYFIYLDVDEDEQTVKGKKVFLFPIIPGITWNFKF
ncbi:TonB-dependent receptor [Pseudoflavitalea sp. X16]|uniref:TonB-dependent receptor plug domain-containing protein n=1 Tax=Paraflavitalea devenefica TaxID=2716334 RepID=UPI0014211833|nr:TonB-dependent receptor [Paraflavitalea devenefica]NII27653.1 TonB-dependent receptor [Paraflavitalea devenefica]